MFNRLIKVLISIKLLILVINDRPIVSAPVSSEEVCSVTLVPKELTANKYEESLITVRCEATLDAAVAAETYEFMNPVFDLSFGGAPRTGLFIVRGNSICDGLRHKCWSEYKISANSVGHLIQNSGSVDYVCQVADQIRNDQKNKTQARCQSTGTLTYSKILRFGDRCVRGAVGEECDRTMTCGTPETEKESESQFQCVCRNGLVSVPIPLKNTICVEEVPLASICNYTKQCSAVDSNAVCDYNKAGVKVCQCSKDSEEYSDSRTDYTKKCRIKTQTTTTPKPEVEEENHTEVTTVLVDIEDENMLNKSESLVQGSGDGFKVTEKNDKTGSLGIVLFFVAIFLAILIVVIIIRVRNRSNKMSVNKRRTIQMQTEDDNEDGEQNQPILSTDGKTGTDEVDDRQREAPIVRSNPDGDCEARNNKINESQKIQTNV